ncbi:hypothetical protein [Streptomyces sp. NPDC058664]|uniref:hypothetical protein n=1 Tax=unclassified Streptomyces TaxID=2593676 RepID=UPI00364CD6F9
MRRLATAALAASLLIAALAACDSSSDKPKAVPSPAESTMSEAEADALLEDLQEANKDADELLDSLNDTPTATEPEADPVRTSTGPVASFTAGTYLVGEDIKAGAYKTPGATDGACYWARSKDDSGELDSIIANHLGEGPARVTVRKGEVFETSGCEEWHLVD